ncbi:alpha-L-fucosidase, putative [Talaromyces stipitatus ATCC 10500]|uniref:alpha-L-fucosidase n=1 Tax=Talaromyces stipitatus (strain ATCC 10500 / CBS 375.48 / QM 6759 / NRRL 1006) TaxID=441959 RepID=B8MLP3_TALSN|nr:alpha-L-fucosidase, putative [Talaromyces stipitatus ATCC 10500]EED13906.1 alpha-L-fucosidase, putative [Talaromyces stipitatus ATCC 10500]
MKLDSAAFSVLGLTLLTVAQADQNVQQTLSSQLTSISLAPYFNNKAFGSHPGFAAFDTLNESYPDPSIIGIKGSYTSKVTGITYEFPSVRPAGVPDNVICEGQIITVPNSRYFSASILVSSDVELSTVSGNVTYTYSDNSTMVSELRSLPWFAFLTINRGEIIFPFRYTANGKNFNTTHIFEYTAALDPSKTLSSITLPNTNNATTGRLHIFAVSLWNAASASAQVQNVRPTQKWTAEGNQVVEVTINNSGLDCISGDGLNISISMPGVQTLEPGNIRRLCPGDQKRVDVGVNGTGNGKVDILLSHSRFSVQQEFTNVSIGLTKWTSDLSNLARHESPQWYDDAKFGLFIHWGPYSVPGWGNSTPYESYAEWFWWYTTHREADKSDFYNYRLRTFGPDWNYDDSFANFTASNWDPKAWVDLIYASGAKYFVLTTKHHDGFALFNTSSTTDRNSLLYGPHRDIVQELFSAAEAYQPDLRRGTYFSLPEWFNPDFGPYGFAQLPGNTSTSWPGIIARNPYTGRDEPYTGRLPINDFITDLMVPQMEILAYNYSTDILWCDCGAANGTAPFAAAWWNHARAQNRQVTINSRCGLAEAADFDTPEYMTFSSAQRRKWESNEGMDPYSYGYNRATPNSSYMNATTIVQDLVDMVSKNGNFLLDIGPRADGSIVEAEANNLRMAGEWIHSHAEAIFNTTYWFVMSKIADQGIRFTQTNDAFYILFLTKPTCPDIYIDAPLPLLNGDVVSVVGENKSEPHITWENLRKHNQKGGSSSAPGSGFRFHIPETAWEGEKYCWVLKISYKA